MQIAGYATNAQANFLVRGWSADFGHDWSQVEQELNLGTYGSFYGQSPIGVGLTLVATGGPYNDVFGSNSPSGIPGFTLDYIVPEPSVIALAALGALALASRRRAQASPPGAH